MEIRHNLLKIEVKSIPFIKSDAFTSDLHNFHSLDKGEIGNKQYCKVCNKEVIKEEIVKGLDKTFILTAEQLAKYQEKEDTAINILGFEKMSKEVLNSFLPLVRKCCVLFPMDINQNNYIIFYSFKKAIEELGIIAKCRIFYRSKSYLGIITILKDELVFLELPYKEGINEVKITREKDEVFSHIAKIKDLLKLKDYAKSYIESNINEIDLNDFKEEKKELLKKFLLGDFKEDDLKPKEEVIENPFVILPKKKEVKK